MKIRKANDLRPGVKNPPAVYIKSILNPSGNGNPSLFGFEALRSPVKPGFGILFIA